MDDDAVESTSQVTRVNSVLEIYMTFINFNIIYYTVRNTRIYFDTPKWINDNILSKVSTPVYNTIYVAICFLIASTVAEFIRPRRMRYNMLKWFNFSILAVMVCLTQTRSSFYFYHSAIVLLTPISIYGLIEQYRTSMSEIKLVTNSYDEFLLRFGLGKVMVSAVCAVAYKTPWAIVKIADRLNLKDKLTHFLNTYTNSQYLFGDKFPYIVFLPFYMIPMLILCNVRKYVDATKYERSFDLIGTYNTKKLLIYYISLFTLYSLTFIYILFLLSSSGTLSLLDLAIGVMYVIVPGLILRNKAYNNIWVVMLSIIIVTGITTAITKNYYLAGILFLFTSSNILPTWMELYPFNNVHRVKEFDYYLYPDIGVVMMTLLRVIRYSIEYIFYKTDTNVEDIESIYISNPVQSITGIVQ